MLKSSGYIWNQGKKPNFGIAVCDLNGFKAVNDRYGHAVGNQMLRLIADTFQDSCRAEDTVARMGGDEFIFLFPSMDLESAHRRLGMLEEGVQKACAQLGIELNVSTSVGLAFYPQDGATAEELMSVADRRMHLQKRNFYKELNDQSLVDAKTRTVNA